jgi:hypothetical protein
MSDNVFISYRYQILIISSDFWNRLCKPNDCVAGTTLIPFVPRSCMGEFDSLHCNYAGHYSLSGTPT